MNALAAHRRRWFQYSLGTLFVLVTALCVLQGWLAAQRKWIRDRHEAVARYQRFELTDEQEDAAAAKSGVKISEWRAQSWCGNSSDMYRYRQIMAFSEYAQAPWSIRILGEKGAYCDRGGACELLDDIERKRLRRLFPESGL